MAKLIKLTSLLLLVMLFTAASAQVDVKVSERIEENLRIKNASIDTNRVTGYRIQIAFSRNQSEVNSSASKFKSNFPEYADRVYNLYQQPYWKVRVCDYYREIDAQKMLNDVRRYFPNAFLVKDFIKRPNLD